MSGNSAGKTDGPETVIDSPSWKLDYKSFLVRVWREHEDDPWRASITHVHTKETQTFSNVQALFLYLHNQVTAVRNDG